MMQSIRTKKAFLLCVLLVMMSLLMTGCHGSSEQTSFEVPETFDTSQKIELVFWAKNDTNKVQSETYQRAIDEFEALYPNVTVTMRLYTDYRKLYNDVITNISTGTTPNVCITYPDHIATYLTGSNMVVPLEDLMVDEQYGLGGSELLFDGPDIDEMIPKFLEEGVLEGHQYAVPYLRSSEALYINKTYVEAMGYEIPDVVTWDYIWEVSEAAMKKNADGTYAVNGQQVLIPFIYKSTDNMMIQMLRQLDADYSTAAGEILLFNDDAREILKTVAEHTSTGAFSTFKISSYPGNFMNAGQCIFAVDSTAGASWIGCNSPLSDISKESIVEFETVVRPVPQYDTENPKMISQGPSICLFNKDNSQEVLASWLFTQYLLTNDVQISYAQTEGYVPVTTAAQESAEYLDYLSRRGEDEDLYYSVKLDATQLLLDNIDNTFVTPVFNGSASVRDAAGTLIENTAKSVRRKQTVDDAYIDALYEDTISLYRLDQLDTGAGSGPRDLGPLPGTAKALIIALLVTWIGIIGYLLCDKLQKRKR